MSESAQDINGSGEDSGKTVEKFSFADGRHYHNEPNCPYPMPNDLDEIDRCMQLDLQHYAIQQVTQKRYHAPLENPKRALDIGTGSGTWLMEMATDFPECEFLGVDIAPLQPTTILPSNCTFELANVLEGLRHSDGSFDYVRRSLLVAAIPKDQWTSHVEECARLCAPGGWVEMVESDAGYYGGGPARKKQGELLLSVLHARGLSPETTTMLDELMRDAGLVDIQVKEYRLPSGKGAGRIGELFLKDSVLIQAALVPLYMKMYNMAREELDQLIEQGNEESKMLESYGKLYVYVGRKP
ncbi:S-adenosyl-L-methionine-dependent methyltransferase [Thamnocephalis sphaerospora]|uniref:S-adenosyl-L-methionine-dependent methyltransferase n=1 Tax=Thamnocephalis sphaerospora TaxID=78915 RepID=A0A4P9XLP5_9FUNG|nr:S-adenosyl-L-methionine-dependent methyltransferase [Thamnocephalis sphaerospora]|eukprot:RKP06190.1 S-adenosyl-L-methionine-dependent methyltransferase [Thamnocephalis sphaerospora]